MRYVRLAEFGHASAFHLGRLGQVATTQPVDGAL
jgi:hypothetical protein